MSGFSTNDFDVSTTSGQTMRTALTDAFAQTVGVNASQVAIGSLTDGSRRSSITVSFVVSGASLNTASVNTLMTSTLASGFGQIFVAAAAGYGLTVAAPGVTAVSSADDSSSSSFLGFSMAGWWFLVALVALVLVVLVVVAILRRTVCYTNTASLAELSKDPTYLTYAQQQKSTDGGELNAFHGDDGKIGVGVSTDYAPSLQDQETTSTDATERMSDDDEQDNTRTRSDVFGLQEAFSPAALTPIPMTHEEVTPTFSTTVHGAKIRFGPPA